MTALNPLELNPTTGVFVAFSPLTHSPFLLCVWSFSSIFSGCAYPDAFPLYRRKITAVVTAFPTWEAGTDGIFSKATSSNLDFLGKERSGAGRSHCPSGLFYFFGSLLHLDAHPVAQALQLDVTRAAYAAFP